MDSKSMICFQEAVASLKQSNGPRAALLSVDHNGDLKQQPVLMGQSIVRLETELIDHLNSKPFSDEFFDELICYCQGRMAAREEARKTGGFVIPRGPASWEIAHAPAFKTLSAGGAE